VLDPDDALCAQTDPELFFPENNNVVPHEAFTICAMCPVVEACLDMAVATPSDMDWGVWGGTVSTDRARIRSNPKWREVYLYRLRDEYAPGKPRGRWRFRDKHKANYQPRKEYTLETLSA
jgi:WhiB family redox-sensing transcriptional regulator